MSFRGPARGRADLKNQGLLDPITMRAGYLNRGGY